MKQLLIALSLIVSAQANATSISQLTARPISKLPMSRDCLMKKMENINAPCVEVYDGKLGEKIEAEKKELSRLSEGADTALKLRCQDELADLIQEISTMDAMKAPLNQHARMEEQLGLITMRRQYVESADSNCLVKEDGAAEEK